MNKLYEETKYIMEKYHIHPNKNVGQNFLIEEDALDTIINTSNINKEDFVLEIGPGLGSLTAKLLELAGKVTSVELDENMIPILNDRFILYKNFELLNEDILKVDLKNIFEKERKSFSNIKVVANLPYYITTSIISMLLKGDYKIDTITILIQKEVAQRICAGTGTRQAGAITYLVDYYTKACLIKDVEKTSFIPNPKVTSSIVKLEVRKNPKVKINDEKVLFEIIKLSFMQRRKTLLNALLNGHYIENKEDAKKILKDIGLEENIRGENLTLEDFTKLSNKISE